MRCFLHIGPVLFLVSIFFLSYNIQVFAEEKTVIIPFGAYDPTFNTPVENWYEPPAISVEVGDTVTWINQDKEGHTVTAGKGPGRFGWMSGDKFGEPSGYFDSQRFMQGESWSFTFDKPGTFTYYCIIHPWMEGVVFVGHKIPDEPVDAKGNKIKKFPIIEYTVDKLVELDMTWEPNVVKTNEVVNFIFQTYDPSTNSNLDKMKYDFIIIQNGREIFRDQGLTGVGGDFRKFVFEEPGPVEIRFENIVSGGTSGIQSAARATVDDPSLRTIQFSTIVYENPEDVATENIVVQPARRVELQYEILVTIIVIPGALAVIAVLYMMYRKPKKHTISGKSSPV